MTDALLAVTMLWVFVVIYAVAAAIDFGAGFWAMFYRRRKGNKATAIANRFLSPSWEITNVFIVLIVIGLYGFFPGATFTLGTVLLIPGSIVLLLLLVRSAFLVFGNIVDRYRGALILISGITGLCIPAILILVLPIAQGGLIHMVDGVERLHLATIWSSPRTYAFILLAVSTSLYLSALFLTDYANASDELETYQTYRLSALAMGPLMIASAFFILQTFEQEVNWFYTNLLDNTIWLAISLLFFLLSYLALFLPHSRSKGLRGRPRLSVIGTVIQLVVASTAYGLSHLPYLVYPTVTLESGFTHPLTFRALFMVYIIGFLILIPGFIYFWKMFLHDQRYLKAK